MHSSSALLGLARGIQRLLLKKVRSKCTIEEFYDRLTRASPSGRIKEGRLLTVVQDACVHFSRGHRWTACSNYPDIGPYGLECLAGMALT